MIKSFADQQKALSKRISEKVEVSRISKTLSIIKWREVFSDFLNRSIVDRTIPLSNVTGEEIIVPVVDPPLAANRPYYTDHGSVEE